MNLVLVTRRPTPVIQTMTSESLLVQFLLQLSPRPFHSLEEWFRCAVLSQIALGFAELGGQKLQPYIALCYGFLVAMSLY